MRISDWSSDVCSSDLIANLDLPNEDARAVDLEDSNLFALNRFAGYDRFEDSTRFTYGVDYSLSLPGISIDTTVGQSYRLTTRSEEHTSELQSLMRISYAVFCLKKQNTKKT